tara:strand:+ start:27262 stop:29199 length:1938 start_codon:yes stop_codon:yes gene_type:complete
MSKSFTLDQLTEGIRQRHMGVANQRLVEKWSRTGLLRGMEGQNRENMSMLLENQAAQLLREQNSLGTGGAGGTSSGDVRGFTNIAFPIVRRVFGGLIANELVSIQPMSLPSGLLFYLDYTYGTDRGGDSTLAGAAGSNDSQVYSKGQSIYNSPTGRGVRSGSLAVGGQYDLAGTGYSLVHTQASGITIEASGAFGQSATISATRGLHVTGTDGKLLQFDPQLTSDIVGDGTDGVLKEHYRAVFFTLSTFPADTDLTQAKQIGFYATNGVPENTSVIASDIQAGSNLVNVRRLNQIGTYTDANGFVANPFATRATTNAVLLAIMSGTGEKSSGHPGGGHRHHTPFTASYVVSPTLSIDGNDGSALTIPTFESDFATAQSSSGSPAIPEIDIKIESIAVTAVTRKLRARWSPELAQDLNAYHSLDAEVELTQILSEQIALEIDREILNDLLTEAVGANYYWSRAPGKFVNKETGAAQDLTSTLATGPQFTGTVREWYETLVETIIDVANSIHRKTLRGSANFIVTSPDVSTIFEASVLYKPNYSLDGQGQVSNPFTLGAANVGSLSNRFTVYKDPYFPRNKVLVGYKGGSYLETGYVYAPYVPLIVTPTIFQPEDFTPRKGVMTRYGKKMVRGDFYGTVTCLDMNVI